MDRVVQPGPSAARGTLRTLVGLALLCVALIVPNVMGVAARHGSDHFFSHLQTATFSNSSDGGAPAGPTGALLAPVIDPGSPAADVARLTNSRIGFAPGRLGVAQPFLLPITNTTDWTRAVDCLAAAAYYEAGRGDIDERAVAQVVLNRVRHPAFPHTVCGVVFQQSDRATGCQFTFTCDNAMARRRPSPEAWSEARRVAEAALTGRTEPSVGISTHYHTDWVLPAWSQQMDKIAAVNTHLFFRWRGPPGAPAAFAARYAGGEARIPKMAMLSPAHAPENGIAPLYENSVPSPVALAAPTGALPGVERLADRSAPPDADVFLVTLNPAGGGESFLQVARARCAGRGFCKVIGWTDGRRTADRLPMPGSAIDAIAFTFTRSTAVGQDTARWDCSAFPRSDPAQCLRRGT